MVISIIFTYTTVSAEWLCLRLLHCQYLHTHTTNATYYYLNCCGEVVADNRRHYVYVHVILPEVGFEPTHPKITELKSAALDHSAIQACDTINTMIRWFEHTIIRATAGGFEPPRAEPTRFRIWRLNHSAMLSIAYAIIIIVTYNWRARDLCVA